MRPFKVQVITDAPTVSYHCQDCEFVFQHAATGDRPLFAEESR